ADRQGSPRLRLPALSVTAGPRLARAALPRDHLATRRSSLSTLAVSARTPYGPRLIRAEILKLTTRRGLMVASLTLTMGATAAILTILAVWHATDPAHHKLIGGLAHFDDGMYSLTQLATIAAVLIGATAGAGDLAGGFFRQLVVTGRPRSSLFAARIP